MSDISLKELDFLIKKHFGFLIDEYGFLLNKKGDRNYDFETSTTKISVFVEYNTLVVGIEPVGEEARKLLKNNILPKQLDVVVVSRVINPDLDYKVVWDEPIHLAMERKSQVVKNNCADFLRGDFTKWIDVLNAIKNRK